MAAIEAQAEKWRDVIDPTREYYRQLESIDELVKNGGLTKLEGSEATGKVMESLARMQKESAAATKDGIDLAKDFGVTMRSAFEESIIEGKKFSTVLRSLADDFMRLLLRKKVSEPLFDSLMKAGSALFGGAPSPEALAVAAGTSDLSIGSATGSTRSKMSGGAVSDWQWSEAQLAAKSSVRSSGVTIVQNNTFQGGADASTLAAWAKAMKADTLRAVAERERR